MVVIRWFLLSSGYGASVTGQITWANRPAADEAERWFRERVRPADAARWATAWHLFAERVANDLPDTADTDGEDEAQRVADGFVTELRGAMRAGVPVIEPKERDRVGVGVGPHEWARAVVLVQEAEKERRVGGFRRQHVSGGLIGDDESLSAWVVDRAPSELVGASTEEVLAAVGRAVEWLGLDGTPRRRPHGDRSVLLELVNLARSLADRYGWSQRAAVTWLLAGGVPSAPMLRAEGASGMAAWDASVTLTVHPDVPVHLVANAYREAQRDLNGWGRPRLLSEQVADAVVTSAFVPGTWAAKHRAHQERHGDGIASADDFRRTVERARAKLLGGGASVMARLTRMLGNPGPAAGEEND